MPDTLTIDLIREDIARYQGKYGQHDPETYVRFLLAHIDALTAAVREMPGLSLYGAEGDTSNDFPLVERAAVLAILGEPSPAREEA